MENESQARKKADFRISSILRARCPSCHTGKVLESGLTIRPRCLICNYNFYPEPGFYMGAMAVGFLIAAMTTIPPMIFLKVLNVDMNILLAFPFVEFLFVGTFLVFYCRILWLHLEYRMTSRLDGQEIEKSKKT